MRKGLSREAQVLRALAHPARLAILRVLRHGPACVCHLTAALECAQPYVSQHLAILRRAGLIEGRREGAFVYYALRDYSVLGVMDLVSASLGRVPQVGYGTVGRLERCPCPRCAPGAAGTKGVA